MKRFSPIVLLTDFGVRDPYVASMKGVILSLHPKATVIDLSHEVDPQDVGQAAFLLEAAAPYFPKGSIFVTVVDPGVGSQRRILALRTQDAIFLAPDNGILSRVIGKANDYELRAVLNRDFFLEKVSSTFHGRDCFAPTAARLAKNPSEFSKVGPKIGRYARLDVPKPAISNGQVRGEILFFDHFGNAFTNISKADLGSMKRGRVRIKGRNIGPIRDSYFEVAIGSPTAVISSTDLLEIAVNRGSAKNRLKLRKGISVEVTE